jgi:hypothetical protein
MYQVLAASVLLAATIFPRLEGQMRATQRPGGPARVGVGSPFRSIPVHSSGFAIKSGGRFVRRPGFVGGAPGFHHHGRFHIFFGNACFNDAFFDPFFCRQFFFRSRFFFSQPVFLPYPVYTSLPYHQVAEQTPPTMSEQETDLSVG